MTRWSCPRCGAMRPSSRPSWCVNQRCPEPRWTFADWTLNSLAALLLAAVLFGALVGTP